MEYHIVRLRKTTYDKLFAMAEYGDTVDKVISEVLDFINNVTADEKQK